MREPFVWRVTLSALLLVACVTDVRSRRIPNVLVLVVAALGLVRAAIGAPAAVTPALLVAAAGGLVGLVLWLPAFALGVLGAGDVKLFAATALWLGPAAGARAAVAVAIAGGVLGGVWVVAARRRPTRRRTASRHATMPYGLAVAAGTLAVAWGLA